MFTNTNISFEKSKSINQLLQDYLNKSESTLPLYKQYPNVAGFKNLIESKPYQSIQREQLFQIVYNQNKHLASISDKTAQNIQSLKENHCYTITTGHQLCLFTGPLYFIYKILSTIQLCETLKKEFPNCCFVPVYWMASEDHDFEEINHFHLFGKKLSWQSSETGAVGAFKTNTLNVIFEELKSVLGTSDNANQLLSVFEEAYLKHQTLADATRFLANHLFAEYGLVIVDGQDLAFKKQFTPFFEKDIFENTCFQNVQESIGYLNHNNYQAQVNPREINCFFLTEQSRNRIEYKDGKYHLVGREQSFSASELKEIIQHSPEKISPNVVLRPLYQQHILPNLAYIGGPGELAYWLEFKQMFDAMGIQFPILVPRNFFSIIDRSQKNKIDKLNLQAEDFFNSEKEIVDTFQANSNAIFELNNEKAELEKLYHQILENLNNIDKSLSGSVMAELQKNINSLNIIEAKANKALKQKSETEINQIKGIKQKLFPENMPQERYDNFAPYYLKYGQAFISEIYKHVDAFDFNHHLLIEN
ncbi:MAG: bacillithiol biosynthesis cysteine-adding enzyme BshC [Bacteroidota bacterium]